MKTDLNQLAARVHSANAKWWTDLETGLPIERNRYELLALVISEVSECLEGERKNLMDDKLPHRRMAEVEMADAYIRLLDYAGGFHIKLRDEGPWRVSDNVGEALFHLTRLITSYPASPASAMGYIASYCEKHGYDLEGAIEEKLIYHQTRADHSIEARKAANGKKF
jgi:hypothetical protein